MRRHLLSLPILLCFGSALAASGVIDGTTKESYERSLKAIADQLTPEEKEVFSKGLINLILTRYPPAADAKGLMLLQFMGPAVEAAHINMNGLSADDILKRGRQIMADQGNPNDPVAKEAITATVACIASKVSVSGVTFEKGDFNYQSDFTITNHLPYAIAGIYITYQIKSDNRAVAWEDDKFVSAIPGGIEPGETRVLGHTFSLLSRDTPPDAKVTMQVVDVADPEKRLVSRSHGGVMGWPDEKSDKGCTP